LDNQKKGPRDISKAELLALGHPTTPVKVIRANCLDCAGGMESEGRKQLCVFCRTKGERANALYAEI